MFKGNSSTKKIDFYFVFQVDWTNITFNMDHFKAISLTRITYDISVGYSRQTFSS